MKILLPVLIFCLPTFLFSQIEKDSLTARTYLREGENLYSEKAYENAIEQLSKAKSIYEEYQLWKLFHQTNVMINNCNLKLRKTAGVKENTQKALANWQSPASHENFYKGRYYYQLGSASMFENNTEDLLGNAEKALAFFQKSIDKSWLGEAYALVASYYWFTGDMGKAVEYREQALRTVVDIYGINSSESIKNHSFFAMFLSRTKELDKGIAFAKKAENIALRLDPEKYLIYPYEAFAGLYYYKGDYEKSLFYFRKALDIQLKSYGPFHQEVAEQNRGIAACLNMLERYDEAIPYYQKNIEIHEQLFDEFHQNIAVSQQGIAHNYLKTGQLNEATDYIQQSIFTLLSLETPDNHFENPPKDLLSEMSDYDGFIDFKCNVLFQLYLEENDQKYLEAALETYHFLDAYIDLVCQNFKGEQSKFLLLENARSYYYKAVHICFELYNQTEEQKYLEHGFHFSEKSKAMLLLTSLRENLAKASGQIPKDLLEKQSVHEDEIAQLKKTIYELEKNQVPTDSIDYLKSQRFKKENELDRFREQLKADFPDYFEIKYNSSVATIADIQNHLPDEKTAFITFFFGEDWFPIFKITKAGIESDFKPFDENIATQIEELIDLLKNPELAELKGNDLQTYQSFIQKSSNIYQFLLADMIQPSDEKLILVPDGITSFLPFEILLTQTSDSTGVNYANLPYLFKNHTVRQAFSGTLFIREAIDKHEGQGLLAFAPKYENSKNEYLATRDGFTALKFIEEEANNIAKTTSGISLTHEAATEKAFKANAGSYKILHLAMHAFSNDENPDYSGLIFTSTLDSLEDDVLHAYELYNMNLNAELAVLSACNTGSGKLARGEGVMSLARAFRHAGCPNIVMSLWQADDEATSLIMQDFYKNLKKGEGKDEALRNAKLTYLESSPKTFPHYWSAFVLMGDGEGVDFGNDNRWWLLGLGGILLLGLIWFFRKRR